MGWKINKETSELEPWYPVDRIPNCPRGIFAHFLEVHWKAFAVHVTAYFILILLITPALFAAPTVGGSIMTNEQERDLIIKTIIGEGSSEGLPGMIAIAETIRNRSAMRGLTPMEVVAQPKQYSFWNNPKSAQKWLDKNGTGEAYQAASNAYEIAFNDNSQMTSGATHYYNPKRVKKTPSFAKTYEKKGKIGNHEFFYGK